MTSNDQMKYDDTFKLQVLSDYYSSGMSKSFISRKWGITGRNHGVGSPDHIQESDISMLYYLSHSHFI